MAAHDVPGLILDDEPIGSGASGVVYRGIEDSPMRSVRAVKVFEPFPFDSAGGGEERFVLEAQALQRLQHRAIVGYVGAGFTTNDRWPVLLMEFVTGEKLSRAASGLGLDARLSVILEVLDGLAYAHSQGIYHRDIKPGNVMITPSDAQAVIVDFGLAHLPDRPPGQDLTRSAIGTPGYIPPEVQANPTNSRGPNHDIFASGIMLYEVLAGRRPNPSAYEPLADVDPKFASLDVVVRKAIAPAQKERYQAISQLAEALRVWCEHDRLRQQLKPSPRRKLLREILLLDDQKLQEDAQAKEARRTRVADALAPIDEMIVAASLAAFREVSEELADIRQINFCDNTEQIKGLREVLQLGGPTPICMLSLTRQAGDQHIIFARAFSNPRDDLYDPLKLGWNVTSGPNQWMRDFEGHIIMGQWVLYMESRFGNSKRTLEGCLVASAKVRDPLDPEFTPILTAKLISGWGQGQLITPQDVKEYVTSVLVNIMTPLGARER